MTFHLRHRGLVRLLPLVFAVFGWVLVSTVGAWTQAADKTIFVTVLDSDNKPVKDIGAAEFGVREDTVVREVTSAKVATKPLFLTVLADTSKVTGGGGFSAGSTELIRDIRVSLTAFVRQVAAGAPDAQISLMEFGQAAVPVVNFTSKTADLEKGINRLFPKDNAPSVLLEAIVESCKNLAKKESPRRAIVVLNVEPSEEQSREQPQTIIDALKKSGAQLWAVSLQKGALKNAQRDLVLEVLTKNTGGRREFIVGQSAIETILKGYADALTSQYEVTYKRPAGAPPQNVQVGVARPGLKLFATVYPPQ